ncbi:hypothetical protein JHK85_008984 [Glycine max]|nr:hypothetical protein JHK85_008984 [Glycine max]KAG5065011.1 hypothetical protein JHK86_008742 [Glycine max]
MHELHSVIRKRKGDKTIFTIEGGKYLASRNKLKKKIRKALRNLKAMKSEFHNFSMLSILTEAEEVTLRSLESLLLFICDPKGQPKQSRWSAISKLMHPKRMDLQIGVEHLTRKLIRNRISLLNIFNH